MRTFLMQVLWLVVGTLCLVTFVLPSPAAGHPQEPSDKDVFRSHRKWYVSFVLSLHGKGEATKTKDDDHYTTTWNIRREISGSFELDEVHNRRPSKSQLATGEKPESRFISWDASQGMSDVLCVIDDTIAHESVTYWEAHAETKVSGYSKFAGTSHLQMGRFKEFKCDLKDMIFDLEFSALRSIHNERSGAPKRIVLTGAYHSFTPATKVTDDISYPVEEFNSSAYLPAITDTLMAQLQSRKLELSKDQISFTISEPAKSLPEMPSHPGNVRGGRERFNEWTTTGGPALELSLKVTLTPKAPEDVELLLMPRDEGMYKTWRPEAAIDRGTAGSYIPVKARLQKRGGGEAEDRATKITFTLAEVSHEPGICINYPLMDDQPDQPDMQFVQVCNWYEGAQVINDHTVVCSDEEGMDEALANVTSFDYGGFCVVEATAELESGRVITAHLADDANLFSLRLPKSRVDSHIADGWRADHTAQGTDISTEETFPTSNGVNGDGFSLYEKYRGYITRVNGKAGWSDLDPHTKTLFMINRIGPLAQPGFEFFHEKSGFDYREIKWEESRVSRVINFNISAGRHAVDQHGIVVRMGTSKEFSQAVGGPGLPRSIEAVELCSTFIEDGIPKETLAHELLHCCCVWHHGDIDIRWESWLVEKYLNGDAKIFRVQVDKDDYVTSRTQIKLYSEKLAGFELYPPDRLSEGLPKKVYVAVPHGQHSGDENCIMRYHVADVYPKGPPNEYVWIDHTSTPRTQVCDTVWGHAFNDVTFKPRSRFFEADAESLRGFCMKQMCINDIATQKDRFPKQQPVQEK